MTREIDKAFSVCFSKMELVPGQSYPVTFHGEAVADVVALDSETGQYTCKVRPGAAGDAFWDALKAQSKLGVSVSTRLDSCGACEQVFSIIGE
jgi:antitoxin (DNA-binding transcriptional repressor) of toxin-antitoxin stability system